jgi:hypothetical protein
MALLQKCRKRLAAVTTLASVFLFQGQKDSSFTDTEGLDATKVPKVQKMLGNGLYLFAPRRKPFCCRMHHTLQIQRTFALPQASLSAEIDKSGRTMCQFEVSEPQQV